MLQKEENKSFSKNFTFSQTHNGNNITTVSAYYK